jgi:hypothetical protein
MSELPTLWGDLIDTDELGPIIDKQTKQARDRVNRGPLPSSQLASMIVKPDSPPEEWYKSHQKMLDFLVRYTTDVFEMKEGYHKFLTEYQGIMKMLIGLMQQQNVDTAALASTFASFKEKYNQDMADLAMMLDSATGEDDDTGN